MLLRRAAATLVACVAVSTALSGCDDGTEVTTADRPATAPPTTASAGPVSAYPTYVALGDSYTAAPGVPHTDLTTGCLRSDGNYPNLVAAALGSTLVDVSCSGATTGSLTAEQATRERSVPPQLDALQPGTSLVTLGIGGNDLQLFEDLVGGCSTVTHSDPGGSPCRDFFDGLGRHKNLLLEKVDQIRGHVVASLRAIHRRSPHATVLLVGYPQPVPATGTCAILPLARQDYPYVRSVSAALNDTLEKAAHQGGATYVDVMKASQGHDICAGDEAWVNGADSDLAKAIAYHPFAVEQQAVARLVLARLT